MKIVKNKSNGSKLKPRSSSKVKETIKRARVRRGPEKQYSIQDMKAALNAVGKGVTMREAGLHYGMPKTTIHAKYHNHSPIECKKGSATQLSTAEEEYIAQWILECADRGFPVSKTILLDNVERYMKNLKRKSKFKEYRPGPQSFEAFMNRRDNLRNRISQNLTTTRLKVTELDIRGWFTHVEKSLKKKNLLIIEPSRVFNLDESAFAMVPKDNQVIARRGASNVYKIVPSNDKANLTVLFIASADGRLLPAIIVFDCKTIPRKQTLRKIPSGWPVGHTESGWMTAETFYHYINKGFIQWIQQNKIQLPVVLYVDGHISHLSLPLMKLCKANQIELIALYPNATPIYQPLDVTVFHTLKSTHRDTLRKWKLDNDTPDFKKDMFAPVLDQTLKNIDLTQTIKNGFISCGLCPFNPNAINYKVLSKKKSKVQSAVASDISTTENNKSELLAMYEQTIISDDVLRIFKKHYLEEEWSGDLDLANHFYLWKKLASICDEPENKNSEHTAEFANTNSEHTAEFENTNSEHTHEFENMQPNYMIINNIAGNESHSNDLSTLSPDTIFKENSELDVAPFSMESNDSNNQIATMTPSHDNYEISVIESSTDFPNDPSENVTDFSYSTTVEYIVQKDGEIVENNNVQKIIQSPFSEASSTPNFSNNEQDSILDRTVTATIENLPEMANELSDNAVDNTVDIKSKMDSFKVPEYKKNTSNRRRFASVTPVATVDDLISVLEEKENKKCEKEYQTTMKKKKLEESKILKKKQENISKCCQEKIKTFLDEKKDINSKIKQFKEKLKSKCDQENQTTYQNEISKLLDRLDDIDHLMAIEKMASIQNKIKIKKEKV